MDTMNTTPNTTTVTADTKENTMSTTQNLRTIDLTEGDAAEKQGSVIIHDIKGKKPSIISYDFYIIEALKDMLLEEILLNKLTTDNDHEEYTERNIMDYYFYYSRGKDTSVYEEALGVSIELYADYLKRINTNTTKENTMKFNDLTNTTTTEDKLIVIMPDGEKLIIEAKELYTVLEDTINSYNPIEEEDDETEWVIECLEEISLNAGEHMLNQEISILRKDLLFIEEKLDVEFFLVDEDFYEKGMDMSLKKDRHYFSRVTISHSERELW